MTEAAEVAVEEVATGLAAGCAPQGTTAQRKAEAAVRNVVTQKTAVLETGSTEAGRSEPKGTLAVPA